MDFMLQIYANLSIWREYRKGIFRLFSQIKAFSAPLRRFADPTDRMSDSPSGDGKRAGIEEYRPVTSCTPFSASSWAAAILTFARRRINTSCFRAENVLSLQCGSAGTASDRPFFRIRKPVSGGNCPYLRISYMACSVSRPCMQGKPQAMYAAPESAEKLKMLMSEAPGPQEFSGGLHFILNLSGNDSNVSGALSYL